MFAGFKGTPPLNQAGHTSTVLISGTNSAIQQGVPPTQTLNNIVIGSGYSIMDPTSSNNILIGNADWNMLRQNNNAFTRSNMRLTSMTGGGVIIIGSFNYTDNTAFDIPSGTLILGRYTGAAAPGQNSVTVGSGAASGTTALAIGYGALASASSAIAIGNTTTSANNAISIGIGGVTTSGNYSINMGPAGVNKANNILLSASSFGNAVGDFAGVASFTTGTWAATTAGLNAYMVGNNLVSFWTQTIDATPVEIGGGADGTNTPTNYIVMSNIQSMAFDLTAVARISPAGAESAAWKIQFLVTRGASAATTAIIGAPIITSIGATAGATSGAWAIAVTADTTNGRPAIKVTGQAATTIRWTVTGSMTKIAG